MKFLYQLLTDAFRPIDPEANVKCEDPGLAVSAGVAFTVLVGMFSMLSVSAFWGEIIKWIIGGGN